MNEYFIVVRGGRRTHDDSALNTAQFASTRFPRTREGRKGAFDSSGEKTRRGNKEILEFDGRDMKRLLRKNGGRDSSGSKKICWNVFKNQAREFCLATGLHGYKYVAQSQRSKIERYGAIPEHSAPLFPILVQPLFRSRIVPSE